MRHLAAALAVAAVTVLAGPAAGAAATGNEPPAPTTKPSSASTTPGPGSKGVTPVAGTDRLVAPLGVDPACPARMKIGMRGETGRARFADLFVVVDPPLGVSRSMLSSYLPPGHDVGAKLLVAVPPDTPEGTYDLRLRASRRTLTVPVEVVALDRLDNGGNHALRRPVTASSQHTNANYPPCSVVDGDPGSNSWAGGNGWNDATARAWPDTLAIDLGGPKQVSRVDLYTLDTERYPASRVGLRDWDVQTGLAGQWRTVAQVRGNTAGSVRSDFPAVSADAVRIVALASNGANDYTRVIEVEVR